MAPICLACIAFLAHTHLAAESLTAREIEKIRAESKQRCDDFFRSQKGRPLTRSDINEDWKNRGDFTRHYCQSIVLFAMRAFYLGEQTQEANAALRELCEYHLARPKTFLDVHSFPSATDALLRLCKFYGPRGSKAAGRMDDATYDIILKTMWEWSRVNSRVEDADVARTRTLHLTNSENHHAQHFSTCWGFALMLKDEPAYQKLEYNDRRTAREHFDAWSAYLREYLRQRAAKGMLIEIDSPSYAGASLRGIFSLHDFSEDPVLRRRAGLFLDLYWALWAEQQIEGANGGGKTRCYAESAQRGVDFVNRMTWYATGMGDANFVHASMLAFVTTTWRMPDVVIDLVLDAPGRGTYEVRQRRMGLLEKGAPQKNRYRIRPDFGGILRYAWCTPDFVMGSVITDALPLADWTAISSQNRWSGVIFRGAPDARVYARAFNDKYDSVYNGQWTVQAHGTQISQRLRDSKAAQHWGVYFSTQGLSQPARKGRWLFAEAAGAYVAVCVTQGDFELIKTKGDKFGRWIRCTDKSAPVIIEAAAKNEAGSFADFQEKILSQTITIKKGVLEYTGLGGDHFTFYCEQNQTPKINGQRVNYAPRKVFDSPFVQSEWDSAVVTLKKGSRVLVLDFNKSGADE